MFSRLRKSWQALAGNRQAGGEEATPPMAGEPIQTQAIEFDIAPHDPLLAYFLSTPGLVEINKLEMDSPALAARIMRARTVADGGEISFAAEAARIKTVVDRKSVV